VAEAAAKAERLMNSTKEERSGRILVPLLAGSGNTPCCMLKKFHENVRHINPNIDVFVFSHGNRAQQEAHQCPLPDVHYMELQEH
jgi:hypothetical protein